MKATDKRLVTVYIDETHRERLGVLVSQTSPKPKLGGMVEHLIDQELERKCIDPKTLKPIEFF